MNNRIPTLSIAIVLLTAVPFFANVQLQFVEGASKDRFVITSTGGYELNVAQLKGHLPALNDDFFFDVRDQSDFIDVFHPVEMKEIAEHLATQPRIFGGDQVTFANTTGLDKISTSTRDIDDPNGAHQFSAASDQINKTGVSVSLNGKTFFAATDAQTKVTLSSGV
ncbi:MAG: hypothetical protein ABJ360_26515 [Roseobacter sp.]